MAVTILLSQDTIKSCSPATVPPPQVLALGPGLGEWSGCLPEIWTFFREKHRWPISLIQALSKEWLHHSHPQPQANGAKANGEALPAQRSSWEGRKGKVPPSAPLKFAGRHAGWAFPGGRVGYGDTKCIRRGFPIPPTLWQQLCTSYPQSPPHYLKTWLGEKWEDNQIPIDVELVK